MRIVLWFFIGLLSILISGFFYLGFTNKEISYQHIIEIDRSQEVVFNAYVDHQSWPKWMFGLDQVVTPDGTDLRPGDQANLTFSNNRKAMQVAFTITDLSAPNKYAFEFKDESFSGSTTIDFEDLNGKCLVKVNAKLHPDGFLMRAILGMAKSDISETALTQYKDFKKFVESEPTTTYAN